MIGYKIANLTRHERETLPAYWTADIVNGDEATPVSSEWGSWLTPDARHEVKPMIAAALQREVGRILRAEARA